MQFQSRYIFWFKIFINVLFFIVKKRALFISHSIYYVLLRYHNLLRKVAKNKFSIIPFQRELIRQASYACQCNIVIFQHFCKKKFVGPPQFAKIRKSSNLGIRWNVLPQKSISIKYFWNFFCPERRAQGLDEGFQKYRFFAFEKSYNHSFFEFC